MMRRLCVAVLLLGCCASSVHAVSSQYGVLGPVVTFADTGGNVVFAQSNKATNTGQISDIYNKGTGAQVDRWELRCTISLTGTHTMGQVISYFIATRPNNTVVADGDGGLPTSGAPLTSGQLDKLRNLMPVGNVVVDQITAGTSMTASFRNLYLPQQYLQLVMWNNTAISTETSTTKHKCVLTGTPPQMQ